MGGGLRIAPRKARRTQGDETDSGQVCLLRAHVKGAEGTKDVRSKAGELQYRQLT